MRFRQPTIADVQGFSLVEMLVVVLIMGVISIGLFQTMVTSRDAYEQQKVTIEMQQNGRAALESLADDFRHVSYGKDPTQPSIIHANHDTITFVADIVPAVPGAEVISYSLSDTGDLDTPNPFDTILIKTVTDSGGTVIFVEPQSYGIKQGGLNIRYFNGAGVEFTTMPVASPELVGEVLISVTTMEPRQHKRHNTYLEQTLSTTVYPRNLPLTPARSRPSIPTIVSLTAPNCESVTVTWSTPTTNTDGSPLALEDISHFTIWFGEDPADMAMYSRTARTVNQWTVSGLNGGTTYHFGVTCTSRSGVESYMQRVSYSLAWPLVPNAPTGLTFAANPAGSGWRISWSSVTLYTSGDGITTPVDYNLYRSTTSGFVPTPADLFATQEAQTWAIDSTMSACTPYYFVVTATACGNEGAPATEVQISSPVQPGCVSAVAAVLTATNGEIQVSWTLPTQRADGSTLESADISGCRVYYDTTPYSWSTYATTTGTDASAVISGLVSCTTYYVNVRCYDQCPQAGAICSGNETAIETSIPCDPGSPAPVSLVRGQGHDQRIDLAWHANETDCDLAGYLVYYGTSPGGPYNGSEALEGSSPILFGAVAITGMDDSCRVSLTGLTSCQGYVAVVATVDGCTPPNTGSLSPERAVNTECLPCATTAGCVAYTTAGPTTNDLRLELYSTAGDEAIYGLTPQWSGAALVTEVWAGRPLVCIWDNDGSLGGNGNVGPQASGAVLDVADFTVPSSAWIGDGLPLRLVFDSNPALATFAMDLEGPGGGVCSAPSGTVRAGLGYDDFDDGNVSDWSFSGGTWTAPGGELYQSVTTSGYALYPGTFTDVVIEAKVKVLSGATTYVVFRGDIGAGDVYLFGLRQASNIIRVGKYVGGSYTTMQQATVTLTPGTWHMMRVEVRGQTVTAYWDCEEVFEVTDAQMEPTGRIGFRTYSCKGYFDDFRVYAWSPI